MSHRSQLAPVAVASSVVGVSTGAMMLALEHLIDDVLEAIFEAPVWVPAVTVVVGAIVTAVLVQLFGGRSSSTTETYVQEFHKDEPTIDLADAPGRLGGAFTTLALQSSGGRPRAGSGGRRRCDWGDLADPSG